MGRRLARYAVLVGMLVVALVLCADVAYLITGSLEEFPTAEDESKVRVVTAVIGALLLATEAGLWLVLRHLRDRPPSAETVASGAALQ